MKNCPKTKKVNGHVRFEWNGSALYLLSLQLELICFDVHFDVAFKMHETEQKICQLFNELVYLIHQYPKERCIFTVLPVFEYFSGF